jgi:hypothetical protein
MFETPRAVGVADLVWTVSAVREEDWTIKASEHLAINLTGFPLKATL